MTDTYKQLEKMMNNKKAEIKKDYKCYVLETTIFLTLGILTALVIPAWPFSYEIILIPSLLIGGISLLLNAHLVKEKKLQRLFTGTLLTTSALTILIWPVMDMLTLNMLFSAILLIKGIYIIDLSHFFRPLFGWEWMAGAGYLSIGLGAVIVIITPFVGAVAIALSIALSFFFYGTALCMIIFPTEEENPSSDKMT